MLGKALSLAAVAALTAAGAVQASSLGNAWEGKTAHGGYVAFVRHGNVIHHVLADVDVKCTTADGAQRDATEQVGFDKLVRIGARGRIHTTQHYRSSAETWTLTFDGTLGAASARGKVAWTYARSSTGYSCRGKGTTRWTARRGRPVADPL